MSRVDVSSEPSMEDILASIRKIIAEEPPGSRPLPPPVAQPLRSAEPAQIRTPFARALESLEPARHEPVRTEPVLPEPTVRRDSRFLDGAPFQSREPSLPLAPAAAASPATEMATPVALESQTVNSAIKNVEDQLSDLLGDAPNRQLETPSPAAAAPAQQEPAPAPTAVMSQGSDFASMLLGRNSTAKSTQSESEIEPTTAPVSSSGFTVSRAGYIPDEAAPSANSKTDPFEFDLGPSPFETAKTPDQSAQSPRQTAADAFKLDIDDIVAAVLDSKPTLDALTTAPADAQRETTGAEPAPQSLPAEPASAPVVRPSWVRTSEDNKREPYTIPVADAVAAPQPAAEVSTPNIETVYPVSVSDPPAPRTSAQTERSMEDTVADLLRPMLRSWLTENMPKIVERALIREISDQNLIARKTAAE